MSFYTNILHTRFTLSVGEMQLSSLTETKKEIDFQIFVATNTKQNKRQQQKHQQTEFDFPPLLITSAHPKNTPNVARI